jgi:uridine kinase
LLRTSGKTSLALEIVASLNLPWVVILSMDSFYKPLTPKQSAKAFLNEWDFDSPDASDFDLLVDRLKDIKQGRRAEIPIYSFAKHQREEKTTSIYSPHVLILEGIFALHDPRVLALLDLKIFAEADPDLCLARRITRDVQERGRDIEGCIKQWFSFVKPNYLRYVEPQRGIADIIIPRGIENRVAIDMVVKDIQRRLKEKSRAHQAELTKLGKQVEAEPLSRNVLLLKETPQIRGMNTIINNPHTNEVNFIFYLDRMATLLIERAFDNLPFQAKTVTTPLDLEYKGLAVSRKVSAVVILRGGACFETGLKRVIADCLTGRLLIQTNVRTGEPELHYKKLPDNISTHDCVLLLDPQMSSGGAALMAVRVLVDHGVPEKNIVFVTYFAGKMGLNRLLAVFPEVRVVVCRVVDDYEERWIEKRYFGC